MRRQHLVRSLLLATALGVATGLYLHNCQQRAPSVAPGQ